MVLTDDKRQVIEALAKLRSEWEEAANGASLTLIEGSVGLILADVAEALKLTSEERTAVLGQSLAFDVTELCAIFVD